MEQINSGTLYGGMHMHIYNSNKPLEWDQGNYTGETLDGKPHGQGIYKGTGWVTHYTGGWRMGLMHGEG